jgi:hypothetical protein
MNMGSGKYRVLCEHLDVPLVARIEEDGFPFMLAPVRSVHQVAQRKRDVTCEAEVVHLWSTVHIYLSSFMVYLINNELGRMGKEAVMACSEQHSRI